MIPAMSRPWGQWVVHAWQEAHSQGVSALRAMSAWPSCTARMIWLGFQSNHSEIGHPLVHFEHW